MCLLTQALGEDEVEPEAQQVGVTKGSVAQSRGEGQDLQLPDAPTTPIFPAAPTHTPAVGSKQEEVRGGDGKVAA